MSNKRLDNDKFFARDKNNEKNVYSAPPRRRGCVCFEMPGNSGWLLQGHSHKKYS